MHSLVAFWVYQLADSSQRHMYLVLKSYALTSSELGDKDSVHLMQHDAQYTGTLTGVRRMIEKAFLATCTV